jgi:hypothetical protein
MRLTGHVDAVSDRVDFTDGMNMYTANGDNSVFAATRWTEAEFGVYGDGGGGRANFNAGASLTARTWVNYGSDKKPICTTHGFTGETNNLHFGPAGPVATLPAPALKFNESSAGAAVANCSAAVAVGDVHETTFAGTAYDFQATGDFEMAQIGSDFEVQTRQISGAPTWPNTAMNQAIGTRLGQDVVTVCSGPRLFVNGRSMRPPDGSTLPLPGGGTVSVSGGAYNMTDKAGNSVRVTPRFASPNYLDVSAGAGQWPTKVRGLLGNPNNDRDLLEASDGTVFQVPLSFDDLYRHFGDSWRVKSETSLLTPCGKATEVGNPTNTFYARDLNQDQQARGHTICGQFGVQPAWLDACVLDVAVLGENAAAGYAGAPNPITNGNNLGKKYPRVMAAGRTRFGRLPCPYVNPLKSWRRHILEIRRALSSIAFPVTKHPKGVRHRVAHHESPHPSASNSLSNSTRSARSATPERVNPDRPSAVARVSMSVRTTRS